MKNRIAVLLILVFCIGIVTGCGQDQEEIEADFAVMVSAAAAPEHIVSTSAFLDENIGKVSEESADRLVFAYEEYLHRYITETRDQTGLEAFRPYFDPATKKIDPEKIKGGDMNELYESLTNGCILVVMYQEEPTLWVDYNSLLARYGEYLSDPLYRLYDLYAEGVQRPMTENAVLIIGYPEILERADRIETLLSDYPGYELIKTDGIWLYTTYVNTILMGTTNTPIFDYKTKAFSVDAEEAYKDYMRANPDTILTEVLNEYFAYLTSIDFTLDYNDKTMSKVFFDTCDYLVSIAEKRVSQ